MSDLSFAVKCKNKSCVHSCCTVQMCFHCRIYHLLGITQSHHMVKKNLWNYCSDQTAKACLILLTCSVCFQHSSLNFVRLPRATYLNYSFPVCFKKWTTIQSQRGAPSEKLLKRATACLVGSREFSRMNPAFCSNSCVVAGSWCSCAQLHLQVSLDGFHLVALALLPPLREAAWVFTDMSFGIWTVNLSNVGGVRVQFAILTCWSLIRCMRCCFTLPFRFAESMS